MISAGTAYAATQRFAAVIFLGKGVSAFQADNLDKANQRIGQAITLADLPYFERTRTLVAEQSIRETVNSSAISADQVRTTLQNAVTLGGTASARAIALDPSDPANYIVRGDFFAMIVPLKIEGAVTAAEQAYMAAAIIAPHYPKVYLDLAQLYYLSGDTAKAQTFIDKALTEKSNYTDAYFLKTQMDQAKGDTAAAIRDLQNASVIDPSNADVFFQLGLLRYQSGDYANAAASFSNAKDLNPQYLNAWYYLALSDQKIGATTEANAILTALHAKFPDNAEITAALIGTGGAAASDKTPTTQKDKTKKPATSSTDTSKSAQ
jgi:tetratricopeptide (TPR) repeat protein